METVLSDTSLTKAVYSKVDYETIFNLKPHELNFNILTLPSYLYPFKSTTTHSEKPKSPEKDGELSTSCTILAALPKLPFFQHQFDLALCMNGMTYQKTPDKQISALIELCRVAKEVRIYPLLSSHQHFDESVGKIILALQQMNIAIELKHIITSTYQNILLKLAANECLL